MSVVTEKKPLIIQIPGERTPNELPLSASAVGYDFVEGNYIYYSTGSDSWVTAPEMDPIYWQSDTAGSIFTTGSISISGSNPDAVLELEAPVSKILAPSGSLILSASTGIYVSGSFFASGVISATLGLSGSLTKLTDGTPYLLAGTNVTLSTGSNGAVTINAPVAGSSSSKYVVYVAKDGSDSSVSGSVNSPFLTIQAAINYIETNRPSIFANTAHVVIKVGPGVYGGDVTITKPYISIEGHAWNRNTKNTQINGLVNVSNTTNPGGGVSNTTISFTGLQISPPSSASAPVITYGGTGQPTLVLDSIYGTANGNNTYVLFVSKSGADGTASRLKINDCIFTTDTAATTYPTVQISNVYTVFEGCTIDYSVTRSGGCALDIKNVSVEYNRGYINSNAISSSVIIITGSISQPFVLGSSAVTISGTNSSNGINLTAGSYLISNNNGYGIPSGSRNFVISGSATSYITSGFDSIIDTRVLLVDTYSRRRATMVQLPSSASFVVVP